MNRGGRRAMGSSSVDQRRRLATDGGRDSVLHATIHRGQRTNERPRLARAERATHGSLGQLTR